MTIEEVLSDLSIPIAPAGHRHTTKGRLNIRCPHCEGFSGDKFMCGVHTGRLSVNCWRCGPLPLVETLAIAARMPEVEVGRRLVGVRRDNPVYAKLERLKPALLPTGRAELLPIHKRFLKRRGFDPEEIVATWGVQGFGMVPKTYAWRIFIPVTRGNEVVTFTTRYPSDVVSIRYLSAPEEEGRIGVKDVLYGSDHCTHAVAVQEGPLDAWAVGPGAVATCGLGVTDLQLLLIAKYPVRIVCFDNEPQAQRRADQVCRRLAYFPGETHRVIFSGKDASRSPKHEIQELRKRFL